MKKTTSFHLEEDILNEIEEYKKEHNLSSRNIALERMLLERRFLVRMPIAAQSVAQIEAARIKLEKNEEKKKHLLGQVQKILSTLCPIR